MGTFFLPGKRNVGVVTTDCSNGEKVFLVWLMSAVTLSLNSRRRERCVYLSFFEMEIWKIYDVRMCRVFLVSGTALSN